MIRLAFTGLQELKPSLTAQNIPSVRSTVAGFQTHNIVPDTHHLPLGEAGKIFGVKGNRQALFQLRIVDGCLTF